MRSNPKIVSLDPLQAAAAGLLVPNAPPMMELMEATADTPGLLRRLGYTHPYDLEEEVLGSGTYARAFATPSGEVLKLTTDPADAAVSQLVARDGPLPGLIRVKAVYRMPAKVRLNRSDAEPTADLYAVISERVTPLADLEGLDDFGVRSGGDVSHEAVQLDAARVGLAVAQSNQDLRDLAPLRDLLADAMSEAEYSDIDEQGALYLYDLVRGWYWMAQRGFHMKDLHKGNVALTEDGRAVLLDLGLSMRGAEPDLQLAVNPSADVDAVFDETFDRIEELFPDFGTVEFYEDPKAGSDNGAGSDRQYAYCQDGNPLSIAFAPKAAKLARPQLLGLMRHEFGHALEYRYGVKELEKRLGKKLPPEVERRADAIAELVWGEPIVYDERLVQCVGVNGVRPRPAHLPDEKAKLRANPGQTMLGYKVMRFENGRAVSGADSRQGFVPRRGDTIRMPGKGIFLTPHRDYALTYYGGHDCQVLLTLEFRPADITSGNLSDREPEVSVPSAKIVDFEVMRDEDADDDVECGELTRNGEGDTVTLPAGSLLFHGSLESFGTPLRPGGDGVLWFSDSPAIAQLYISCSGIKQLSQVETIARPSQDRITQALQRHIGIEYDYDEIEFDPYGRPSSWRYAKGFDHTPTKQEVTQLLRDRGFEVSDAWSPMVEVNVAIEGEQIHVFPGSECREGRLFIARTRRDMRIYVMSKGEGDLTDVQYNEFDFFAELRQRGFDGLIIDDFAQSEAWGNLGHLSLGLFAEAARDLDVTSVPAKYEEFEMGRFSTQAYPEPVTPYLVGLRQGLVPNRWAPSRVEGDIHEQFAWGNAVMEKARAMFSGVPRIHTTERALEEVHSTPLSKQRIGAKPAGFWYACGLAWIEFQVQESFRREVDAHVYGLDIDYSRMLVIRNEAEWTAFDERYGIDEVDDQYPDDVYHWIDWPQVARDYKGIEICPHLWDFRHVEWYSGWDIASGCIWDVSAIKRIFDAVEPRPRWYEFWKFWRR